MFNHRSCVQIFGFYNISRNDGTAVAQSTLTAITRGLDKSKGVIEAVSDPQTIGGVLKKMTVFFKANFYLFGICSSGIFIVALWGFWWRPHCPQPDHLAH